jgi:hypothetical protein
MHGLAAGAVFLLAARTDAAGRLVVAPWDMAGRLVGALVFVVHSIHQIAIALAALAEGEGAERQFREAFRLEPSNVS